MIKAVIFDVDGTLVDSVDAHARAWREALLSFGYDVEYSAVRHQIGKGGDQLMKVFLSDEELKRHGREIEAARKKLFAENYLPHVQAFPRVRELFLHVHGDGRRIVLASSAAGEELEAYKTKADISDLVEDETSKDDAEKSKPEPDIFEAAFRKLRGVDSEECVVIGDTPWDAIAARRAGLRTVGFLSGGFPEDELREAGCVEIYEGAGDLLNRMQSSILASGA